MMEYKVRNRTLSADILFDSRLRLPKQNPRNAVPLFLLSICLVGPMSLCWFIPMYLPVQRERIANATVLHQECYTRLNNLISRKLFKAIHIGCPAHAGPHHSFLFSQ